MISPAAWQAGDSPRTPALTAETGHRVAGIEEGPIAWISRPPSTCSARRWATCSAPRSPPRSSRPRSAFARSPRLGARRRRDGRGGPGRRGGGAVPSSGSGHRVGLRRLLRSGQPRRGSAAHPRPARARAKRQHPAPIGESIGDAIGAAQEPRRHARADGGAPRRAPDRAGAHRASDRGQAPHRALEAPAHRRDAAQPARPRSAARGSGTRREAALRAEITALWLTERSRTARPAVTDEVRTGLYFVEEVFWDALPSIAASSRPRWPSTTRASSPRAGGSRWPRGSAATATATRRW